jgi:hypothetical protein
MTTITREDWDTLQRIAGRMGGRFVLNDGITITDPEPPEAMVKLAREIAASQYNPFDQADAWTVGPMLTGQKDGHPAVKAALAALQHVEKVVRDAPVQRWERLPSGLDGTDGLIYRNALLAAIGAKP